MAVWRIIGPVCGQPEELAPLEPRRASSLLRESIAELGSLGLKTGFLSNVLEHVEPIEEVRDSS